MVTQLNGSVGLNIFRKSYIPLSSPPYSLQDLNQAAGRGNRTRDNEKINVGVIVPKGSPLTFESLLSKLKAKELLET